MKKGRKNTNGDGGIMRKRSWISSMLVCAIFALAAFAARPAEAAEPTADQLWKGVVEKWDNDVKSYSCDLFSYAQRTKTFIKNFPEYAKEDDKPDWDYNVFQIRFRKPGKTLLKYRVSLNEDFESGSIIDKGVSYMLAYTDGTTFNFGHKDSQNVYIVFPYLSNSEFAKMPIAIQWKATLKLLMIASRKEVYHKKPDEIRDLRGFEIPDIAIGKTIARYQSFFDNSNIAVSKVPLYVKEDFEINTETGVLTMKKNINRPAEIYKLTMTPKTAAAGRGVSKLDIFIDPKTSMFAGLMEYEGNNLVHVKLFSNLKLNPDLPDKLWEDFFKGRKLSDKR